MPGNIGRLNPLACHNGLRIGAQVICLLTLIAQSAVIDFYLIHYNRPNKAWYAWILADVVVLIVFIVAFVLAQRFYTKVKASDGEDTRGGELPLGYLTWLIYAVILCAKVAIIFKNIAWQLTEDLQFGPNTLKSALALSCIIFLTLVLNHDVVDPDSGRQKYVDALTGSVTMDVLDVVAVLDVLFLEESRVILPFELHKAIIAIACINILLPTVPLVILSRTRYGKGVNAIRLKNIHMLLSLLLINVPLLVIRMILWHVHSQNVSVFVIKNVVGIGTAIKRIHDGWHAEQVELSRADRVDSNAIELHPMTIGSSTAVPQKVTSSAI